MSFYTPSLNSGNKSWSGTQTVTNSTASTTNTSGALVVTGGVGIGGAVNIGGAVDIDTSLAFAGGQAISSILTSTSLTGATNSNLATALAVKTYVDGVAAGLDPKASVRTCTTQDLETTFSKTFIALNGTPATGEFAYNTTGKTITFFTGEGPTALNGVTLANGDRILVKDETATSGPTNGEGRIYNGIYVRTDPLTWTRATDFDGTPANEVSGGAHTFVESGVTTHANTGWVVVADGNVTVDSGQINFSQFSSAGTFTGGDGIDVTGTVISVDYAAAGSGTGGLTIVATELAVLANNSAGIELLTGGVSVRLEGPGSGTGGLAFNGSSGIRVDVGLGLELLAGGVTVDLQAAGSGTGGLSFTGNEIGIDLDTTPGLQLLSGGLSVLLATVSGLNLTSGLAVSLEAAGTGTGGLAFDNNELRIDVGLTTELTSDGLEVVENAFRREIAVPTTTSAIAVTANVVLGNPTGGNIVLTLPSVGTAEDGKVVTIKNIHATNFVQVARADTDLIDGAITFDLNAQYESISLVYEHATTTWWVI